ncbi:MAG: hypothetical protein GKS01_02945 [Alphaproteobacteria bacterium]|nr:hypothetical protein [Alphaproteobacteria bacterium]
MQQLPEGIYFESTPAFDERTGQQHAYLVYRDGKGGERVIRGGPEALTFGKIEVQADIPLSRSEDAYEDGDTPETRNSKLIDLKSRDPETVWKNMAKRAKEIDHNNIDYNLFSIDQDRIDGERNILTSEFRGQNSNSVIRAVLESSKIDVRKIISEDEFLNKFHGIDNDLSKPAGGIKPKRPPTETLGGILKHVPLNNRNDSKPRTKIQVEPNEERPTGTLKRIPLNNPRNSLTRLTPAAKRIEQTALQSKETLEEILAKSPDKLSETEINRLTRANGTLLSNDPRRERVKNSLTAAHERIFADGQKSNPAFPSDITPASTPAGLPVTDGIKQVVGAFLGSADDKAMPDAVSGLQTTLNHVDRDAIPLKVDGIFGDKTRNRLRATVAEKGPEPILNDFGNDDDFDVFDDEDVA